MKEIQRKLSENILVNILHSLYPASQIDHVGQTKETGDVILSRKDKPKILIENKDWGKNVVQEEVKKDTDALAEEEVVLLARWQLPGNLRLEEEANTKNHQCMVVV